MRHILYILFSISLVFPVVVDAQQKTPPKIEWQKCLGGTGRDEPTSIQQTNDGGYIVVGGTYSSDGDVVGFQGEIDCWVVKLTSTGVIEWQKSLGGTNEDLGWSIRQTAEGGYIMAGYSSSADGDVTGHHGGIDTGDYWIVKLTSIGTIEWQKSLGGSRGDGASSIQQTTDGGYAVAGTSTSVDGDITNHHGNEYYGDYWIVKLTSTGVLEWEKSLGGSHVEHASCIQQTTDGGFVVAGSSYSSDGDVTSGDGSSNYWIVKLTSLGVIEWEKSFGGNLLEEANFIQQTADSGYIITGYDGLQDYWIIKLKNNGEIEWQKSLGGSWPDIAYSIQQTTDGGYIVAGSSSSTDGDVTGNHGNDYDDCWIVKLTGSGGIEWQKSFGGDNADRAYSIQQTSDAGYIFVGQTYSTHGDLTGNHGASDFWIVKLSPEGTSSVESEIVTTHNISISPNPASTTATLSFESDEAGACEVQIISVTGATLKEYSTYLSIGKQEIALTNLESLPSGVYEVVMKYNTDIIVRGKLRIIR